MKFKRILAYVATVATLSMMIVSCSPAEEEFDESLLIGTWLKLTENGKDTSADLDYWEFNIGGTGYQWMEREVGAEGKEDRPIEWELTKSKLVITQFVGTTPTYTKTYTITELTSNYMSFKDGYTVRTFKK